MEFFNSSNVVKSMVSNGLKIGIKYLTGFQISSVTVMVSLFLILTMIIFILMLDSV